jgi:hypothetical protein
MINVHNLETQTENLLHNILLVISLGYHHAVICVRMVCTRYIHTRQDTLDSWYLLVDVGSRCVPGSCHDVTGQAITWISQMPILAAEKIFFEAQVGCERLP